MVTFVNQSTIGSGIKYTWNFGLGDTTLTNDPSNKEQIYITPKKYKVTLTVSDGISTASVSKDIIIAQGPKAKFTADPLQGCAPLLVNFSNTSIPGDTSIKNVLWDFRNGETGTGNNVQYSYNQLGKYDIILKVIDNNGCYDFIESDSLINVVKSPSVNFTATDTFACNPPLNVTFINLSSGSTNLNYLWNFGNSTTSKDFNSSTEYNSNGSYNVKLVATDLNGCSDSIIKRSFIRIGHGNGNIIVKDTTGKTIAGTLLCNGKYNFSFSLNNLSDYKWVIKFKNITSTYFGSNVTFQVNDSGRIDVKLIYGSKSLCPDSTVKYYIVDFVKADFTLDNSFFCQLPQNIKVNSTSKNAIALQWIFPDGSIDSIESTNYNIINKQNYQQIYSHQTNSFILPFTLIATNINGCSDKIKKDVTITLPIARFMPDKVYGCVPLEVIFSDSSKSQIPINKWVYKFENDSIVRNTNSPVKYTFNSPGEYTIKEIISTNNNCTDTSYNVFIKVGTKLSPDFSVSPITVCNGGQIHITAQSDSINKISSWNLLSKNIFNLSLKSKPDTSITVYTDTVGLKNVELQVSYNGCISDTIKKNSFSIIGPTGDFFDSFKCDSPFVYNLISKIKPATSLTWKVDTSAFNTPDSLKYTFHSDTDYTVKLIAYDNVSNCTLIRNKIIKVRKVKADFYMSDTTICAGDSVIFNASPSVDYIKTCYNEGFLWDFNDYTPPKRTFLTNYTHHYNVKGIYKPVLIVKADNGCEDTIKKTVHVFKPDAKFSVDKTLGCVPEIDVKFISTSIDSNIVAWSWIFGDNTFDLSNNPNTTHTYKSDQTTEFMPNLLVKDKYGCIGSYTSPVKLIKISSNFQAMDNALCLGQGTTFTPVENNLTNFTWYFGDGFTSNNSNYHLYTDTGIYTVKLIITKDNCTDSTTRKKYISVEKADASYFIRDSISNCYPDTVTFIHNNTKGNQVYSGSWTFGSLIRSRSYADSIQYVYTAPGTYTSTLTVNTFNGCEAKSSRNVIVNGPTATFDFEPKRICYGDNVNFHIIKLNNVDSWQWLYGDGSTSTSDPSSHKYTSRGIIFPKIWLINKNCSVANGMDTLFISNVRANFSSIGNKTKICYGNPLDLVNNSTPSTSYNWEINNTPISSNRILSNISFDKVGDYYITLIVTDLNNCTDTFTKKFSYVLNPDFKISGDSIICQGKDSTKLTVKSDSGWNIIWTPAQGLSNDSSFSIFARPNKSTSYTAKVTDKNECFASNVKLVIVDEPSNVKRYPAGDTSIIIGDKIQLTVLADSNNVHYSWSPDYNISCRNCNNPYVAPYKDVTYKVDIKDKCFDFIQNFNIKVIIDFFLEAPGAFTPNGDNINDTLIFKEKNIKYYELKIFNRWGEIVFSSNNPYEGWDGKINGKIQNIDSYTYFLKAETFHGYKFEKKGSFLLLK